MPRRRSGTWLQLPGCPDQGRAWEGLRAHWAMADRNTSWILDSSRPAADTDTLLWMFSTRSARSASISAISAVVGTSRVRHAVLTCSPCHRHVWPLTCITSYLGLNLEHRLLKYSKEQAVTVAVSDCRLVDRMFWKMNDPRIDFWCLNGTFKRDLRGSGDVVAHDERIEGSTADHMECRHCCAHDLVSSISPISPMSPLLSGGQRDEPTNKLGPRV